MSNINVNKYCRFIINGLSFHQLNIRFCTTLQLGEILSIYDEESPKELADKIYNIRRNIRKNIISGNIPDGCNNCIYRSEEYTETYKITKLNLFHWYHCNCGCFYCSYRDKTKGEFSDKQIYGNKMIYETIKELYKMNEISNSFLVVTFGGGEISVLKEFPKLIDLFIKHNVEHVWCESSGIAYSKPVEKLLKRGKGSITVAVCAGTKETYQKIKQRDKYKQVMKNLSNYVKAAEKFKENPENAKNVISKFIILKGFNDNKEEINAWLEESKKYGLKQVEISMEFCWSVHSKCGQKVEDYNYEIFDYVEKRCKEIGLSLIKNHTSTALMENGVY